VLLAPLGPGQPPRDLAHLLLSAGYARVRDAASSADEESLRTLETQAKEAKVGLWADEASPTARPEVSFGMSGDAAQAFLVEQRGKEIDAIVESVRDGSTMRLRLILPGTPAPAPAPSAPTPEGEEVEGASEQANAEASSSAAPAPAAHQRHQFVTLSLAGLKAPKTSSDAATYAAEPLAEESKFFVESRLLQREVKCVLISSPASIGQSPMPGAPNGNNGAASNGSQASAPAFFIGLVRAPQGSIGDFLVQAGLAKVLDWHAGLLSSFSGLDKLRAAEKAAKDGRKGIWESFQQPTRAAPPSSNGAAQATAPAGPSAAALLKGKTFQAVVTRVWSGDSVSIVESGDANVFGGGERRVQLSSVRAPRATDPKLAFWANEGKECVLLCSN
jgi:staphylococcal nuclease domain-containing protein 1